MWRNYMNLRQKKIILVISFSILMIALMIVRYTSISDILYVFLAIAAFVWLALFVSAAAAMTALKRRTE